MITPQKVSDIVKNNYQREKMTLVLVGDKESIEKQAGE
jgi:predicted Zn-dependent peptidase